MGVDWHLCIVEIYYAPRFNEPVTKKEMSNMAAAIQTINKTCVVRVFYNARFFGTPRGSPVSVNIMFFKYEVNSPHKSGAS